MVSGLTLLVQVPDNYTLAEILTYFTKYYPQPKYVTSRSFGPLEF